MCPCLDSNIKHMFLLPLVAEVCNGGLLQGPLN